LGGILELSPFWVYERYPLHSTIVDKVIHTTIQLIEDLITDCAQIDKGAVVDAEGIDLLVEAILVGVQRWMQREVVRDAKSEHWFDNFVKLIQLLLGYVLFHHIPSML
jgi:hypothetical protein